MDRAELGTPDLTEQNIDKIAELFPQVITEALGYDGELRKVVDFEALRQELSSELIEGPKERYQFTWPGKQEAKLEARRPINKTLRPVRTESVDFDTTENLYIEGDNLDALKLLRNTYAGKIKMIYIDPPYNTGNDFIYEDDFSENSGDYEQRSGDYSDEGNRLVENTTNNGRFHSDWCSMMYPRLLLAKDLLSKDGVLFASIDDNEIDNLQKILDEIFGSMNFVSRITVIVKPEGRRYGFFAKSHEYLLVYCKDISFLELNEIVVEGSSYSYVDNVGGFNLKGLRNRNVQAFNSTNRPNLRYPFFANLSNPDNNGLFPVSVDFTEGLTAIDASTIDGLESVWRWGKDKSRQQREDLVAFRGNDGQLRVFQKERKLTQTAKTVWSGKDIISNKGTKELQALLGKGVFDFPKPLALLNLIETIGTNEDSLILDFFSGSATSAHAMLQLNSIDEGSRRFILVQLPEKVDNDSEARAFGFTNICEIGKERIKRAGKGIREDAGLLWKDQDIGFRVLKIDSSNFEDTYRTPDGTNQASLATLAGNLKLDRSPEDLLFEVLPAFRIPLSAKIETTNIGGQQVFNVNDNQLLACFDIAVTTEVVEAIAKLKPIYAVFRDASFANDSAAANFEELFKTYSPDTVRKVV